MQQSVREKKGEAIENAVLNFWPCTRSFCDVRNPLRFVSRRRQDDSDNFFVIKRFSLCLFVCLLHSERNLFLLCYEECM